MVVDAEHIGGTSTSNNDSRITRIGRLIRALKLDEVTQLWNVLKGDMSLVGPRPNIMRGGVELYTDEEMHLLSVRPGITDYSSIVFSDEGAILASAENPDLAYNQLIRPWKSRLSLHYIQHQSFWLDIKLVLITILAIISRPVAEVDCPGAYSPPSTDGINPGRFEGKLPYTVSSARKRRDNDVPELIQT